MNPSDPGGECYKQGPSMGPCTILGPINGTLMNTNYLGLPRTLVNNSLSVVDTATSNDISHYVADPATKMSVPKIYKDHR